ncbi:hypothetical protein ACET3Z_022133 [Daucus carota]
MAGPRSSSPVLTRPTTNPNLRASETNSSIRRSFTGNPFARPSVHTSPRGFVPNTPANSPAEFGRKLPVGKEGSFRGFEEKENEKLHSLKAIKCKSPLKASKNFMSPTISAASKFTPSPRKKILGERNEPIRTSISFSDGQESSVSDIDTKSESGFNQNTIDVSSEFTGFNKKEVLKASKRVTFSDEVIPIAHHESSPFNNSYSTSMFPVVAPYEVSETPNKADNQSDYDSADNQSDYDSVILDSSLDPKPFSSPAIAPLDADPSFPPYDPKTNYLSPRPQFLRYKPHRRMEVYLSKEGLHFEESKEFEDTEVTEETDSGDSQKESEDGSTTETLPSEEEEASLLSEPTPAGTPISDQMLKHIVEAKPDSFTISKSEEEELLLSEPIFAGSPISTQMLKPGPVAKLKSEEEEAILLSEPTPSGTPVSTQMLKQISEAQRAPKQGFFTRSKCISLLLVLLIGFVSISVKDVSITSSPVIKDLSFYKLYESSEVAALARNKIDKLADNLQHWYDTSEIAAHARENFDGLLKQYQQWYESFDVAIYASKYSHAFARDFKQYSSQTISYLSKLIPRLGEVDNPISGQFCNLTDSQEHSGGVGYFDVNHQKIAEIHDDYELKPMVTEEAGGDYLEEKAQSANVFNEQNEESEIQEMIQAEKNHFDIAEEVLDPEQIDAEVQSNTVSKDPLADVNEHNEEESKIPKMVQAESYTEEVLGQEQFDTELQSNIVSEDQSILDSAASEAKSEVITPVEFIYETKSSNDASTQSKPEVVSQMGYQFDNDAGTESKPAVVSEMEYQTDTDARSTSETAYEVDQVISEVIENKPSAHAILGISFLVISVVVASAFTFLKWKNTTAVNGVVHGEPKQTKDMNLSKNPSHEDRDLQNSPTNYDMSGESCPSEMSSFQNTSSYSKGPSKRMHKAQSQERKSRANTKRESLASSSEFSTGSPSYGSFTTYERIPLKHAYGEEEIVTPVRRSSRIRSQITSP